MSDDIKPGDIVRFTHYRPMPCYGVVLENNPKKSTIKINWDRPQGQEGSGSIVDNYKKFVRLVTEEETKERLEWILKGSKDLNNDY